MKKLIYILIFVLYNSSLIADQIYINSNTFSNFEQKVKEREDSYVFLPLQENEGLISRIETLRTMIENFDIIDNVRKGEIKNDKLKKILNTFDDMIKNGKTKINFIRMYNYLESQLLNNRLTKGSENIITVLEKGGDCNDVTPMFFSIFRYYGFDNIWIVGGESFKKGKKTLHVWLYVEWMNTFVELDPLWYGSYIELNRMNGMKFDILSIKDEYIKKK